jgi:hypothetical protein
MVSRSEKNVSYTTLSRGGVTYGLIIHRTYAANKSELFVSHNASNLFAL